MYVYTVAYIKLYLYRGWQASHRKCAISDIAITSARNYIFWQDKKQLIGHREGFIYFRSRVGQGACQHPNSTSIYIVYKVLSIYRVLPGFREFAVFTKSKRFFILFLDGRYREGIRALARAQIYIVYKVLSIYRVLPGFREFAVFEKSKRFFILFFGWAIQRGMNRILL